MIHTPLTQFETRAFRAQAAAVLASERRAARAAKRSNARGPVRSRLRARLVGGAPIPDCGS